MNFSEKYIFECNSWLTVKNNNENNNKTQINSSTKNTEA